MDNHKSLIIYQINHLFTMRYIALDTPYCVSENTRIKRVCIMDFHGQIKLTKTQNPAIQNEITLLFAWQFPESCCTG